MIKAMNYRMDEAFKLASTAILHKSDPLALSVRHSALVFDIKLPKGMERLQGQAKKDFIWLCSTIPCDPADVFFAANMPVIHWRYFVYRYMTEELGHKFWSMAQNNYARQGDYNEMKSRGGLLEKAYQKFKNKAKTYELLCACI